MTPLYDIDRDSSDGLYKRVLSEYLECIPSTGFDHETSLFDIVGPGSIHSLILATFDMKAQDSALE